MGGKDLCTYQERLQKLGSRLPTWRGEEGRCKSWRRGKFLGPTHPCPLPLLLDLMPMLCPWTVSLQSLWLRIRKSLSVEPQRVPLVPTPRISNLRKACIGDPHTSQPPLPASGLCLDF